MTTETRMLDLSRLLNDSDTKIISGKERGMNARREYKIEDLDMENVTFNVILPAQIKVIAPSFFMGMFSASVRRIGDVNKFLDKYKFQTTPSVLDQITQAAKLSLVEGHALS
jgi:hypothetical protein